MKTLKLMALVALMVPMLMSCSQQKSESTTSDEINSESIVSDEINSDNTVSEESIVESAPEELDFAKILTYRSVKASQMTEKDYDFFLDQLEIFVKKATELPPDQAKNYIKTFNKEQQEAIFGVALVLADQSKLTDKQKKRYEELEKLDPAKR